MRHLLLAALLLASLPAIAQEDRPVFKMGSLTIPPSVTVAALPTCSAATAGWVYIITNALTPVLGVAVVGGGVIEVVTKCNGTSWLVGQ